ncbi:hypothetical protein K492DRAFT_199791 [Lichtheimia hyalospora FSU 10163]|nr:hypothetical protein K492DRAFT_199791 [Lichtheimia hyalospora FSU 10163]
MVSHEAYLASLPYDYTELYEPLSKLLFCCLLILFLYIGDRGRSLVFRFLVSLVVLVFLRLVLVIWWWFSPTGIPHGNGFHDWYKTQATRCASKSSGSHSAVADVSLVAPLAGVVALFPGVVVSRLVLVVWWWFSSTGIPQGNGFHDWCKTQMNNSCASMSSDPASLVGTSGSAPTVVGIPSAADVASGDGVSSGDGILSGVRFAAGDDISSGLGVASSGDVSAVGVCSGDDVSSGVCVSAAGDISAIVGVASAVVDASGDGISSGVPISAGGDVSADVAVAFDDDDSAVVDPVAAEDLALMGVSAGVVVSACSEDDAKVNVDDLCTAFMTLTVEDPYDEDVYMCLLDRRDFYNEEHVEMMELVEEMDYEEDLKIMPVVCAPVACSVPTTSFLMTPLQDVPIILSRIAIPHTSPSDPASSIPMTLSPSPMQVTATPDSSLLIASPLPLPTIAATSNPVISATSNSPIITANTPSPLLSANSPSPIIATISPMPIPVATPSSPNILAHSSSPIVTATSPLAIPSYVDPMSSAMLPISPITTAFVTSNDILSDMNTVLTATPATTTYDDPIMTTIDPLLLHINDDIPFMTMLMTDILLPTHHQQQPQQEQQDLPSPPPQSSSPSAPVVDDYDTLFDDFISMPDE